VQGDALREPLPDADEEPDGENVAPTVTTVAVGDTDCDALVDTLPDALLEIEAEPHDV